MPPQTGVPRRDFFGFAYDALAQAVGGIIALAVVALAGIAAGAIQRAPATVIPAVVGLLVGAVTVAVTVYGRERWLGREALHALWREPEPVYERLRKAPFVPDDATGEEIRRALDALPRRERTIVLLRFGESRTLADIGADFGITRERVRQIEQAALRKLEVLLDVQRRYRKGRRTS